MTRRARTRHCHTPGCTALVRWIQLEGKRRLIEATPVPLDTPGAVLVARGSTSARRRSTVIARLVETRRITRESAAEQLPAIYTAYRLHTC